ncbi:MAG: aquaporin Z [Candidatus Cloacimonetes bacterium]|nr:aquaporin Z [Candidatus Cloacimonadota bacterium]
MQVCLAEFLGTFILVLGGCGTAVFAGGTVSWLGVSFAFGLTIIAAAYGLGHISGAHLNPAVTLGAWMCGRLDGKSILPYIVSQIVGAIAAAGIIYCIATGNPEFILGADTFAVNGYGDLSPNGYGLCSAFIAEFVLTFVFLIVILGATDKRSPVGFAGLCIGFTLALIHLISIPITNTSVNPARSISQAVFVGGEAVTQLWLFIVAPILGGILAGLVYKKYIAE